MKPLLLALLVGSACASVHALPLTYDNLVRKYSAKYGHDPLLIHAQIQQESGHNASICSGAGACGLMQIMPLTAPELGLTAAERFNPEKNIAGGTLYMRRLLSSNNGIMAYALYSYNWGAGNFGKYKKGLKKMPAETRNYVINIARFYQQYGGKGDYFSNIKSIGQNGKTTKTESIDNTNRTKIENMQKAENVCPRVKLPEQEISNSANVAIEVGGTVAGTVSGSGKTVFDPAKFAQLTMAIQKAKESLDIMRGQYDALTKGLAGLGLLTNIATVAGYEMPSTMNENVMVKWGNKQDVSLYRQLQEMKAADTGVYASAELDKLTNQNAAAINRAYTEAELAWSKANCAANNLDSLMKVKAKTQKQAKDLNNAIRFETAVIEANEAKIKANLLMMNSSYQSYRISASQIYANWKASK